MAREPGLHFTANDWIPELVTRGQQRRTLGRRVGWEPVTHMRVTGHGIWALATSQGRAMKSRTRATGLMDTVRSPFPVAVAGHGGGWGETQGQMEGLAPPHILIP